MRIGYLVPEFPGQTHVFFFRELAALRKLGLEPRIVSTRRPRKTITVHDAPQDDVHYLYPPSLGSLLRASVTVALAGPRAWSRMAAKLGALRELGLRARLRVLALFLAGAGIARIARREGWAHLHVHSCGDAAFLGLAAHIISDLPYSLTLHGSLPDYGPGQAQKWEDAAFAIVITRTLLADVERDLAGHLPPRIRVAPMGVDIDRFRRAGPYAPWPGQGPLSVVSCARLNPCKGHHVLIEAVGALNQSGIDTRLTILGADDSTGAYRRVLEALVERLSLVDKVKLPGPAKEAEVVAALEAAHVFALASQAEPLGVAIMEAMSMELPVVVTNAGGVPELVTDGSEGLLVPPGAPAPLAEAIALIARDPSLALRLGAQGRVTVASRFHSGVSALTILDCLAQGTGTAPN